MPQVYLSDKQRTLLLNMLWGERELLEERVEYGLALPEELEEVCLIWNKLMKTEGKIG